MKKTMKKAMALLLTSAMVMVAATGCGSKAGTDTADTSSTGDTTTDTATTDTAKKDITISFLNSKGEIQLPLETMAATFEEATGIKVEIMACGAGESPYTKITSSYNAGTPPTMAMLDTTDIVALGAVKAVDLSGEKWIAETEGLLTKIDDKVYSFPFCVEGRGIIYNKAAIEKTLGETFDPATINSYDALADTLQKLRDKGMENPVVISKEDWSLGAHQLQYIYETKDGTNEGTTATINAMKDGSLKVADYDRFNQFTQTLDLLLKYNINGKDPLGAIYEQDPIYVADGEAAFWFNGSWAWPNLADSGAQIEDGYGFIPYVLGNDTADFANNQIQAAASKQVMIDNVVATEEEKQAAKDFLNWIVYDEAGQKALVEGCNVIPASKNNSVAPADPLGTDIKNKMAEGKTFIAAAIVPGDHWGVLGAQMQKYIAEQSTTDELAASIEKYWAEQK